MVKSLFMSPQVFLTIILVIIAIDFLFEQFLDYLNLKQPRKLPALLEGIYEQEKYEQSIAYHKAQTNFSFITSTFSFVLTFVVISSGLFGSLDGWLRGFFSHEITISLAFVGIIFLVSDIINLPFQLYSTFVIEEKFDFNKMTPKLFVIDKLKGYLLGLLLGGLILSILLALIIYLGQSFWIYFFVVICLFLLLMNMFYTSWILPLFNKLTPLEEGPLKTAIENYAAKVAFPLDHIMVIDGSKRSNKANAFFSGLGKKKKIVLYDTLVKHHTEEELVAVLAHEVGHYKKKHIVTGFALSLVQIGVMLFIMSLLIFNPILSEALGASQLSIPVNLIAFGILYSPISKIAGILMQMVSRKNEYEADAYAANTYHASALIDALKKLSVNNLSNLVPHQLYVFFHYSHPPLLQRLKALHALSRSKN